MREDAEKSDILDTSISNPVKNLKVQEVNPTLIRKSHPILKVLFKDSKHPSFIAVNNVANGLTFQFLCDHVDDTLLSKKLSTIISNRSTEILIYILKEKADIFSHYICNFFNNE